MVFRRSASIIAVMVDSVTIFYDVIFWQREAASFHEGRVEFRCGYLFERTKIFSDLIRLVGYAAAVLLWLTSDVKIQKT